MGVAFYCGDYFCARPRGAVVTKAQDPTSKENPPTCYLIRQKVGGFSFDVRCFNVFLNGQFYNSFGLFFIQLL